MVTVLLARSSHRLADYLNGSIFSPFANWFPVLANWFILVFKWVGVLGKWGRPLIEF